MSVRCMKFRMVILSLSIAFLAPRVALSQQANWQFARDLGSGGTAASVFPRAIANDVEDDNLVQINDPNFSDAIDGRTATSNGSLASSS